MTRPSFVSITDPLEGRSFKTVEAKCYHCHRITRFPAETVESAEAEFWRQKYDTLLGKLNGVLSDCRTLHGDDPVRIFTTERLIEIRDSLK